MTARTISGLKCDVRALLQRNRQPAKHAEKDGRIAVGMRQEMQPRLRLSDLSWIRTRPGRMLWIGEVHAIARRQLSTAFAAAFSSTSRAQTALVIGPEPFLKRREIGGQLYSIQAQWSVQRL